MFPPAKITAFNPFCLERQEATSTHCWRLSKRCPKAQQAHKPLHWLYICGKERFLSHCHLFVTLLFLCCYTVTQYLCHFAQTGLKLGAQVILLPQHPQQQGLLMPGWLTSPTLFCGAEDPTQFLPHAHQVLNHQAPSLASCIDSIGNTVLESLEWDNASKLELWVSTLWQSYYLQKHPVPPASATPCALKQLK